MSVSPSPARILPFGPSATSRAERLRFGSGILLYLPQSANPGQSKLKLNLEYVKEVSRASNVQQRRQRSGDDNTFHGVIVSVSARNNDCRNHVCQLAHAHHSEAQEHCHECERYLRDVPKQYLTDAPRDRALRLCW